MAKKTYVCSLQKRLMETEINNEKKENTKLYWLITLVSAAACVGLLIYSPEWFWLTLPFLFTYFVKAIGMM
jgi:hypothetical protein